MVLKSERKKEREHIMTWNEVEHVVMHEDEEEKEREDLYSGEYRSSFYISYGQLAHFFNHI